MPGRERLLRALDAVNMVYLGILPAVATFTVLSLYGLEMPYLLFIGGTVLVSVYLAVVSNYSSPPPTLITGLLILLDGPFFAILSQLTGGSFSAIAINSFLVDGIAIWLAILFLAVTTDRPTGEQRLATVFFGLVGIGTLLLLVFPYVRDQVFTDWVRMFWLAAGVIEAVFIRYVLLRRDKPDRVTDSSARYIVVFLFVWLFAMIAGGALYGS